MSDVTVLAPEVATLECRVDIGTEEAEIRWSKEAREIHPSKKYDMFFWDRKASLVIKDTEPADSANYRCEIINPLGHTESTGNLTVYSTSLLLCNYYSQQFFFRTPCSRLRFTIQRTTDLPSGPAHEHVCRLRWRTKTKGAMVPQ
jgi:hypothetical protein